MSEILEVFGETQPRRDVWWVILDCGHWVKWTGDSRSVRKGSDFPCPACHPITVVPGDAA